MPTPIRLLFVNHTIGFAQGGAERVLLELLRRMDSERFECQLAAAYDRAGVPAEFGALDTELHILPTSEVTALKNPFHYLVYILRLFWLIVRFYCLLRRTKPDLVHINSIVSLNFAAPASILAGVPFIYHEHNLLQQREKSLIGKLIVPLASRAAGIIAITDAVRDELLRAGFDPAQVRTVHNGIAPEAPDEVAQSPTPRGIAEPGFCIGQIANLHTWKGHQTVIRALALLRDEAPPRHHYIAFGSTVDPEHRAGLDRLVEENHLGGVVEFAGFREDAQALLSQCDCMVLSSDAEPFGLVLLEAMRAGVPVIASNSGGVPEIVRHEENGLLFEAGDAAGLAKALRRLMEDDALRASLIEAGHRTVLDEFTWDAQAKAFMDAIEHYYRTAC